MSQGLFARYHPRLLFSIVPMVTLWITGRMGPLPIHLSRTPVRRTRFTVLVYYEHQSDEHGSLYSFITNTSQTNTVHCTRLLRTPVRRTRFTVFVYYEHQSDEHGSLYSFITNTSQTNTVHCIRLLRTPVRRKCTRCICL